MHGGGSVLAAGLNHVTRGTEGFTQCLSISKELKNKRSKDQRSEQEM